MRLHANSRIVLADLLVEADAAAALAGVTDAAPLGARAPGHKAEPRAAALGGP